MKKKTRRFQLYFDRALSQSIGKQILILGILIFVAFSISLLMLSFSGLDWKTYCDELGINKWMLPLYLLIDGNSFNDLYKSDATLHPYMLIVSSLTYVFGIILFTGMLISVLTNIIAQRIENHENGLIPYLKSGHYIIMGYDDMVASVIHSILSKDPEAYVLLMTAVDARSIRNKLSKSFSEKQLKHILVHYGLRTSKEFYPDIHLEASEEVFIVGNRSLPVHDAMNVECIDSICDYLKNDVTSGLKPKRITCVFEDIDTYAAFKTSDIFQQVGKLDIEFIPYNFYTGWANQVLITRQYIEKRHPEEPLHYPSIFGNGITPDDSRFVHLVFVGITNLSVAFAMEAAHLMHFPNFDEKTKRPKTRITFIDVNADKEMTEFITRNRHFFEVQSYYYKDLSTNASGDAEEKAMTDALSPEIHDHDFLDVEFEFIKGDIFASKVQHEISEWINRHDRYLSIFLTMADQKKNFMMSMNMPEDVYDNEIPVFLRQNQSDNFVTNLRNTDAKPFQYSQIVEGKVDTKERQGRYAHLYPFGMNETAFNTNDLAVRQGKLLNYLYATADYSQCRFTDLKDLESLPVEQIWAKADEEWKNLTVALQWSNLYCTNSFQLKLASLRAMRGLSLDDTSRDTEPVTDNEIAALAHVEHNRWNVEKLLMGFRKAKENEDKYMHEELKGQGAKGNKKLFIHYDIRPFDDLDNVFKLDEEVVKYMPWIVKMTEPN